MRAMKRPRRRERPSCFVVVIGLALALSTGCGPRSDLPHELSNQEFWRLFVAVSEPQPDHAMSEHYVSNEPRVAESARQLRSSGGVYIGVGPEQNFTYMARMRPRMAFIIDIRRENADLHLLYKALFELCDDRIAFVSRLFSRHAPEDLPRNADAGAIFDRYEQAAPSVALLAQTKGLVRAHLLRTRALPLEPRDLEAIDRALQTFAAAGPAIDYWGSETVEKDAIRPSYRRLMTMPDLTGQTRSFLADAASFRVIKDLHQRNLIVPAVGDFGGAEAIRRVGAYVRDHHDNVRAFYASNVSVYLTNRQARAFCANLAALPVSRDAAFVDSKSVVPFAARLAACRDEETRRQ